MSDDVVDASRRSMEVGSGSFAAAARLFRPDVREDAWMLYAWCRHCDDVVDGQILGRGEVGRDAEGAGARLAGLDQQTRLALSGARMTEPAFAAFQRVALKHGLELRHALDLLEGFRMDVEARAYLTLQDTLDYAYHVAGVVGVMMAQVMGVTDKAALARAADLGLAFQLTNIARDVLEDAQGGRVYLPGEWLGEGIDGAAGVLDPAARERVFAAAVRLLETADAYYESARWGLSALDFRSAWAVAAALGVYREIGRKVRAGGPQGMIRRAATSRASKTFKVAGAAVAAARAAALDHRLLRPPSPPIFTFKTPPRPAARRDVVDPPTDVVEAQPS